MASDRVLPCPFCGRKVEMDDPDTLYPAGVYWRELDDAVLAPLGAKHYVSARQRKPGDQPCFTMHCPVSAGGCGAAITGDSKEDAIAAWNRRPKGNVPGKPTTEMVEAVIASYVQACSRGLHPNIAWTQAAEVLLSKVPAHWWRSTEEVAQLQAQVEALQLELQALQNKPLSRQLHDILAIAAADAAYRALLRPQVSKMIRLLSQGDATDGAITLANRHFELVGQDFIQDENFDFDAGLKLSGDFSDGQKALYARMICAALNEVAASQRQGANDLEGAFAAWRQSYFVPQDASTKQPVRDAYAAGMGEPPPGVARWHVGDSRFETWFSGLDMQGFEAEHVLRMAFHAGHAERVELLGKRSS